MNTQIEVFEYCPHPHSNDTEHILARKLENTRIFLAHSESIDIHLLEIVDEQESKKGYGVVIFNTEKERIEKRYSSLITAKKETLARKIYKYMVEKTESAWRKGE